MKKSDVKVLCALRTNGRLPLTALGRKSGLPVSTLHERLRQRVKEGVFKPAMLLDFGKLGFESIAFVKVAVDMHEKEALLSFLKLHPQVNSLYRINTGWHALVECVFPDMHDLEDFVESLEEKFHVRQKEVCYVLDEIRREVFLSDPVVAERLLSEVKLK